MVNTSRPLTQSAYQLVCGQAPRGEPEEVAQLLDRPEVGDHLGEHYQLIVRPEVVGGGEHVAHDDANLEGLAFGLGADQSANFWTRAAIAPHRFFYTPGRSLARRSDR